MRVIINNFSKVLCVLMLCIMGTVTSCYDDTDIWQQLNDQQAQIDELRTLCARQNTNIEALQIIVDALLEKDYATSIAPIKEGDAVLGYTITFSKSGAVTIYNGKDGYSPALGVKQYEGEWYWTIDGEWLKDKDGNKVRASANDGQDGIAGVTPTLKIEDGYWYVSYDGGKTWEEESLGQATGDQGYTMFEDVTYDEEYIYYYG